MTIKDINSNTFDEQLLITNFKKPKSIIHESEYGCHIKYSKWIEFELKRLKKLKVRVVRNEAGEIAIARKQ